MRSLLHSIPLPQPRGIGRVGIRPIHRRDAKVLRQLLLDNRAWLKPWEASHPAGGSEPGSYPLGSAIRAMQRQRRQGRGITFVITFDLEVVGQVSLGEISGGALRSAAIGYWIAEHMAGCGITPQAVALAIDYAFSELQLHRIEICVRPENHASMRMVRKLGLRFEGMRERYIHVGDDWCDHASFAVTVEEVPQGMLARLGAPPG